MVFLIVLGLLSFAAAPLLLAIYIIDILELSLFAGDTIIIIVLILQVSVIAQFCYYVSIIK